MEVDLSITLAMWPSRICTFPPMERSHSAMACSPLPATDAASVGRFDSRLEESWNNTLQLGIPATSSRTPALVARL